MKYGVIDENSVGIMPVKKDYEEDGVRIIKEAKLYEISAVTIAANDAAKILEVKGDYENIDYLTKRFDNLIKVIRKGNVSDEALKLIVKLSEGSVRDSLSLLARGLLSNFEGKELDLKKDLGLK